MPATHKMVNGVSVPLSQEEIDAIESEWLDNTPLNETEQALATLMQMRERAKEIYLAIDGALDYQAKASRAMALGILDEFNVVRGWLASFKAEVAAATTLADLKTRVAGLPAMADRTIAQLKTVIRDKIDAGSADS